MKASRLIRKPRSRSGLQWLLTGLLTAVIILAAGFLLRGWLRRSVAPWGAQQLYGRKVDHQFENNPGFAAINNILAAYKIKADAARDYATPNCYTEFYNKLELDIHCERYRNYSSFDLSPQFVSAWPMTATRLETNLRHNGWHLNKSDAQTVPLPSLLTAPSNKYEIFSNYERQVNSVTCNLDIAYSQSANNYLPASMRVFESCRHDIETFGGY